MSNVNIEYLSRKLQEKREELAASLARRKSDARQAGARDVEDTFDAAEASESTSENMQEITLESATLEQVEDALQRMERGEYGRCVVCGRPIPDARLQALPWTPSCLDHAGK
jgi:DnaK suppressor protein